ncbi:hypothetical protein, partial [Bathymodiolus japonicus methanotrophic gill symbiont]|uniref:hypothetical protein n=1 Tax=Bathymodiolus japonicus methanotrophic gill symbiont TaxID=113269 RepID=UPI001C8E60DA
TSTKKIIQDKSDDSNYHLLILRVISSNGELFKGVNKVNIRRFKKIFFERIEKVKISVNETHLGHPISVFVSLKNDLTDDELVEIFSSELKKTF